MHWTHGWLSEAVDAIYPLATARPDVSSDDKPQGCPVHLRKRLSVHFVRQYHFFIVLDFSIRDGDGIIEYVSLPKQSSEGNGGECSRSFIDFYSLEIRVGSYELYMLAFGQNASTSLLEYLLQRHAAVYSSSTTEDKTVLVRFVVIYGQNAHMAPSPQGALINSSPSPGYSWICSMRRVPLHCNVTVTST